MKMKCPKCNERTKMRKVKFTIEGKSLGRFNADICTKCGEKFFTEEASDKIDKAAKIAGIWGKSK